jgi:succinate dehydrogenase/fumarate reductase flavoprotein subunit
VPGCVKSHSPEDDTGTASPGQEPGADFGSQRNFGGHEYPRLAHVGDRTGLELIRSLQQKVVAMQQADAAEHGDPRR